MLSKPLTVPLPSQIWSNDTRSSLLQSDLNRFHHGIGCFLESEMLEHHLTCPDHADGIGDPFTRNIGCGTVYGLEEGWPFTGRVDIA